MEASEFYRVLCDISVISVISEISGELFALAGTLPQGWRYDLH
jgi:hypothetical protein